MSIGTILEQSEWRQGSIVKADDASKILQECKKSLDKDTVLIIASQSCDIASDRTEIDPTIEFSIAKIKTKADPMRRFNRNPRILHLELLAVNNEHEPTTNITVELIAHEKFAIDKRFLEHMTPDNTRSLEQSEKDSYVRWLAGRYDRPAFPTAFNRRLESAKNKILNAAKKANASVFGLYIELQPNKELAEHELYSAQLLVLTNDNSDDKSANELLQVLEQVMKSNNIDVKSKIASETEVSVAVIKRFTRFDYDYLSLRENTPLPPSFT